MSKKNQTLKEAFEEAMTDLTKRFPDATILATAADKGLEGVSILLHGEEPHLGLLAYNLLTSKDTRHIFMIAQIAGIKSGIGSVTDEE